MNSSSGGSRSRLDAAAAQEPLEPDLTDGQAPTGKSVGQANHAPQPHQQPDPAQSDPGRSDPEQPRELGLRASAAANVDISPTVAFDGNQLVEPRDAPKHPIGDGLDPDATATGAGFRSPEASVNAGTVISRRPVAAPEDFYRSMPLAELAAMLEGRQLDHFAVEQMIGGGGMGAVFRGRDTRLDRVVAIKVIPASRRDPETLRRFRLEAQAAARLDHPNIARVFYVGEAEQWNYIVFEFIDGVNIRDLVEMEGPLEVDDAVYYARQVAEALQHSHGREVVHRDIKPSNVLVTANGHVKVVDMGLARDTSLDKSTADATASGITLGTFDYISPEQARNPRDADVRSDLYSLGCTLFFMLTGHPPFPEGTALQKLLNHGSQPPPDPRGWREDLSDQLFEITMKLMAKRPADRYQKPIDLINDLVLLAELEELPRSQSPGTFLIAPAIAQRSLLETHLPWMVAFAFLLVSTLWLQSVQSLTNDLRLADFEAVSLGGLGNRDGLQNDSVSANETGLGVGQGSDTANGQAPQRGSAFDERELRPGFTAPAELLPNSGPSGSGLPSGGVPDSALESGVPRSVAGNDGIIGSAAGSEVPGDGGLPNRISPLVKPAAGGLASSAPVSSKQPNGLGSVPSNSSPTPEQGEGFFDPGGLGVAPGGPSERTGGGTSVSIPEATPPRSGERYGPNDTLYVAIEQPYDAPPGRWESSLAQAIERMANDASIREIELRGRHVVDRPLDLPARTIRLRGAASGVNTIEFSSRATALLSDGQGLIRFDGTQLSCRNLAFRVFVPTDMPTVKLGLFASRSSGTLELNRCSVTVQDVYRSDSVHVVLAGPREPASSRESASSRDASTGSTSAGLWTDTGEDITRDRTGDFATGSDRWLGDGSSLAAGPISLLWNDCVIRGEASVIGFRNPDLATRLEIQVTNSLVAVAGRFLEASGPNRLAGQPRFVRLSCSQATFVTERGFASLEFLGEGAPQVGLYRTSEACVYWSRPESAHVTVRGASRQSALGNLNLLVLRGRENAYDANIQEICQFVDGQTLIATYGFTEAQVNGRFDERGNEPQVLWQKAVVPQLPLHAIEPDDLAIIASGLFHPGTTATCRPPY